jgi:branched-chain amino acid transport system permease protein
VIIGSIALITLPDMLRQFADYRLCLFGFLLVIMMIARPEGFIPSRRRKLELREDTLPTNPPLSTAEESQ